MQELGSGLTREIVADVVRSSESLGHLLRNIHATNVLQEYIQSVGALDPLNSCGQHRQPAEIIAPFSQACMQQLLVSVDTAAILLVAIIFFCSFAKPWIHSCSFC